MSETFPEFVAAIDLGSNNFHIVVANASGGRIRVVDRMKSMVQLAAGLNADNELDPGVTERALAALSWLANDCVIFPKAVCMQLAPIRYARHTILSSFRVMLSKRSDTRSILSLGVKKHV